MLGCKHRKGVVKYIHLPRQGQTLNQLQDFSFCIRHELILSTLAPRYVFAHNAVYHKNLSDFSIKWGLSIFFLK